MYYLKKKVTLCEWLDMKPHSKPSSALAAPADFLAIKFFSAEQLSTLANMTGWGSTKRPFHPYPLSNTKLEKMGVCFTDEVVLHCIV